MPSPKKIDAAYRTARQIYADWGVNTDAAVSLALIVPLSLPCWPADDVRGLEPPRPGRDSGGLLATGGYPGRARDGDEIRADLDQALALLPGKHRINLHASYAETDGKTVDRDALEPAHFARWRDWAGSQGLALDFNPTYFGHPQAASGATLSHPDPSVRAFWIAHGRACRKIAHHLCVALNEPCITNHWIPDGAKDSPADRWGPRRRLQESLDAILDDDKIDRKACLDAVEGKLFGLGSEDYVVGSHEFYTSYALSRRVMPCLDLGHYHPTESVADKVSALLCFHQRLLLHISRPLRWDSDHVPLCNDDVRALFLEIARGNAFERVRIALDFFDASINRVAAYVIGARATRQALLLSLLDPTARIRQAEQAGRGHEVLALQEQAKALPWGAVWDHLCLKVDVPAGADWLRAVAAYEKSVLSARR